MGHQKRETASKRGTHLVDGRLLDESRGLAGQDAVRRHDEDLVGPSFLQGLGRRHKTVHVIDDVVLRPRHLCQDKESSTASRRTRTPGKSPVPFGFGINFFDPLNSSRFSRKVSWGDSGENCAALIKLPNY